VIRPPRIPLAGGVFLALASLAVVLGACGGGEDEETTTGSTTGSAHIDPSTGDPFEGDLTPDEREGTPPPSAELADLEEAADAAGCEVQLDLGDERELALKGKLEFGFKVQPNGHVAEDAEPEYETSPPTSGVHGDVPLADGAYLDAPEPINSVHSLEHGRVEIQYSPDLSEDDQLALKGVFDEDPDGMQMFPNPEMPYAVAATAWTNLLGCDSYTPETLDAIRAFRDEFRGQGPEDIPL
jgi:hypothetical protein